MPATWPPQRLQIFPGLARPAAKNFAHVAPVVNPDLYPSVLAELREWGGVAC